MPSRTSEPENARFVAAPARVLRAVLFCIFVLAGAGLAVELTRYAFDYDPGYLLVRLFGLREEGTVPAWFSGGLLILCGATLALIALAERRKPDGWPIHWGFLAAIFFALSFDEVAAMHELAGHFLRQVFAPGGPFTFVWVVPAIVLLALLLAFYRRFLMALPRRHARMFLVAGAVYVGGALGMEMVGGAYFDANDRQVDLAYALIASVEETMEMIGLALFLRALADYIAARWGAWRVDFRD